MGVTNDLSFLTESTAKHLSDGGAGEYIYLNGISIKSHIWVSCTSIGNPSATVIITSPYRIRCVETATIELTDNQRLTAVLVCVHGDGTVDATTLIVATEHTAELSARHGQADFTVNGSVLGTTEYLRNKVFRHTLQDDIHITVHRSHLSGTIDFANLQGTFAGLLTFQLCAAAHITQGVTATIENMYLTTFQLGHGLSSTVDTCFRIGSVCRLVNNTHIGTGITCTGTVTTTEQLVDDIGTFNGNLRGRHGSSITTTIDVLDAGGITTLNQHFGKCIFLIFFGNRRCLGGVVVSLVTTAIDGIDVVGGTVSQRCRTVTLISVLHGIGIHRPLHMYFHMTLRRSVQVVTTEYLTHARCGVQLRAVEQHVDIAAHV